MALTPREAAFQKSRRISLREAAGSICAEVISVYPPGIPLLFPGEVFTRQVLTYLEYLSQRNICIYARDPSLSTVSIIDL
jgi:arginine/lysine/ornithine decarboxylase